ncbi:MAG: type II secretion system protein N [Pseudomonadales bacterium]
MTLNNIASRMVEPARWLVIGGIAFTLANTVLFFVAPPETGARSRNPDRVATRTPDRQNKVSITAILSRNLFGEAGISSSAGANNLPSVETRLPLELLGVFVADEEVDSAAIVSQKGKTGELYVVGQLLPGNAELIEVHADHIVLRRAGSRETLRFPEATGSSVVASVAGGASTGATTNASNPKQYPINNRPIDAAPWTNQTPSARDFITTYQRKINKDPEGALRDIGVTPVAAGNANGYRLDDMAANSPYLSQTGLQPGDVVLSVNGQPVGNIQQDKRQIENILAQGSARIEVQRGTRRFFVTASLKP